MTTEKYVKSLLNVIQHFENQASPSTKHETNLSNAIGLFPDGGCRPDDNAPTKTKRKAACQILTKINNELGFDIFLLCSFTFTQTTLYEIKKHDTFLEEIRKQIPPIGNNFVAVTAKLKEKFGRVVGDNAPATALSDHHSPNSLKQGPSKRKFSDTGLAGEEPARQIRLVTPEEGEPNIGPLLSDAPLSGRVYKLSVVDAFRLLAGTREPDLQVQLTMPDSEQWPFVTFRCDRRKAMHYLTELEQIM